MPSLGDAEGGRRWGARGRGRVVQSLLRRAGDAKPREHTLKATGANDRRFAAAEVAAEAPQRCAHVLVDLAAVRPSAPVARQFAQTHRNAVHGGESTTARSRDGVTAIRSGAGAAGLAGVCGLTGDRRAPGATRGPPEGQGPRRRRDRRPVVVVVSRGAPKAS